MNQDPLCQRFGQAMKPFDYLFEGKGMHEDKAYLEICPSQDGL